ncbi:ExeM/NucH family extracellular endonuclease [Deinococcus sp. YIM 134068]|uniref:ExeM/NucH family extracellular endonuclease n=1 Tax=Deinococcus lichenicola TaxID=3118910 RepID=UPI002F93FB60
MKKTLPLSLTLLLASCGLFPETPTRPPAPTCTAATTSLTEISAVQGSGAQSPLAGQAVAVRGVVTGDFQGEGGLNGFFVQDYEGDGDAATSDGVFVSAPGGADVGVGDFVQVAGTVEDGGATQLGSVTRLEACGTGYSVPAASVTLPAPGGTDLERFEGMRVEFAQTLTVTEVYGLGRYGEVELAGGGRLFTPTNGNVTTTPEANAARRVLLDDGSTRQNPNPIPYLGAEGTRRVGDTVTGLTGVLGYGFGEYRVQPTGAVSFVNANPRTERPADVGGTLRVASFNVLNYFTDLGQRGANTAAEFGRQQAKIVAAIRAIDADVLGLVEMQNNGDVALQNLVDALNADAGGEVYRAVPTGTIGTDAIKVAVIYRAARVNPVGAPRIDTSAVLDRPTVAQTFQQRDGNGVFTLVVNHFKSKGSCPTTGDVDTGQGCWNLRRVEQARALVAFTEALRTESGDADVLVVGDLNAYGAEDPIRLLEGAGFESLNKRIPAAERYSYIFEGLSGYLDHALSTPNLGGQVSGVTEWHINADEPVVLDYNTEFRTQDPYTPTPYRSSDHDPVVVGLRLTADAVRAASPTLSVTPPQGAQAGQRVELAVDARAAQGSTLSALEVDWGDGSAVESLPVGSVSAGHTYAAAGEYAVAVRVRDANGQTAGRTLTLRVTAAPVANAPWINELHYDNAGSDAGEFVEVVVPTGYDAGGLGIVLYNGNGGTSYTATGGSTLTAAGTAGGFTLYTAPATGIQNGAPDGVALCDGERLVEFVSYEGTFTATDGCAAGQPSTDIGVVEAGTEAAGQSLQKTGTGSASASFTWTGPGTSTPGQPNTGQTLR